MLSGNILDTYVDAKNNTMVTWLISPGKATKITDTYEPTFYVYASQQELLKLASNLQDIPEVKHQNFTKKKLLLGSEKQHFVLEVTPKTIASLTTLASMIDYWGKYRTQRLLSLLQGKLEQGHSYLFRLHL